MNIDKELLASLLREAKDAHAEYEATLDEADTNWPEWYADYILERLEQEVSELEPDEEVEELDEEENV